MATARRDQPYDPNDPLAGLDPAWLDYPGAQDATIADPTAAAPGVNRTVAAKAAADQPGVTDTIDAAGDTGAGGDVPPPAFDPLAPNNQPSAVGVGAPGNGTDQILSWYHKYQGRTPDQVTPAEIQAHLKNPGGLSAVENLIANSPEAQAYAAAHQPTATAPPSGAGAAVSDSLTGNKTIDDLIAAMTQRLSGLGGSTTSPTDPALRASIMDAIQKLLAEGLSPVGDVSQTPQARAYQVASQRNAEQDRRGAAARRASQGLLFSGPMETDINAIDQQRAERQGSFEAHLTTLMLQDKKDKLTAALNTGAGLMAEDQRAALQSQLQAVNSELAKSSIQLQLANSIMSHNRFYDDLGYRIGSTQADINAKSAGAMV